MTNKSLLPIIILIFILLTLVGCNATSDTPTPDPDETEEVAETPEVDETPEADETPEVDETEEVIDIDNPLPSNDGEYYVAPAYATREDNVNVVDAPEGYYWVVATVTLGNETGESTTVDMEDIYLIGNDGLRYETYEMAERVAPTLVNTELAEGDSVYGFALFALPSDVEPSLFEWCPGDECQAPLQAQISLQD